eukprot:TRINITY_DN26215_c0_g1_i3.p1 TRINITY_DN26215_c0_g1~~TRINITY_DN26215_c0_g1_i3.p1  ORF type:complete len:580 (-),score=53.46 TRINITY_DN26215_c0_g1_i3:681-2420(-)
MDCSMLTRSGHGKIFLLFVVATNIVSCRAENFISYICNSKNFSKSSAADEIISRVLDNLANASRRSAAYNTSVVRQGSYAIYGLMECRGDTNASQCLSCATDAKNYIRGVCNPFAIGGRAWFEHCYMRYEKNAFIGNLYAESGVMTNVTGKASDPDSFSSSVKNLLNELALKATKSPDVRYASGENSSSFPKIYGLVQCWRDLNADDCETCLNDVLTDIYQKYASRLGVKELRGSCIVEYQTYSFFNPSTPSHSPAPEPSQNLAMPSAVSSKGPSDHAKNKLAVIIGAIAGAIFLLLLASLGCFLLIKKSRSNTEMPSEETTTARKAEEESLISSDDLKIFAIGELKIATNNFNDALKLGQGGFGAVYKGILPDGKAIAVKKLSAQSFRGNKEAMNEIQLLAQVQHRNLVNIVGCCIDGSDSILVFEYFSNGSLEQHLFGRRKHLDWHGRYNILVGIAKGLVYLHEDSKVKIIHRDIKASNILLDDNFNPKITDFGIAKLLSEDETEIRTRVAGTYGYMAPEYAMQGHLSRKADVYSYGILLLEIISGRRNTTTSDSQDQGLLELVCCLKHALLVCCII